MMLNDRMADGKTHPHAMFFGRKQWLEDSVDVGEANSDPGILDRDMHAMSWQSRVQCPPFREIRVL